MRYYQDISRMTKHDSLFRSVDIPGYGNDRLFLHSLPGVDETMDEFLSEVESAGIQRIISLLPLAEIKAYSPEYANFLLGNAYEWEHILFGVPNYGIPTERENFLGLAIESAKLVFSTDPICTLLHCYAGIGRTGTFGTILLMAGGIPLPAARYLIRSAGSGPETQNQHRLIEWCEKELIRSGILPPSHGICRQEEEK